MKRFNKGFTLIELLVVIAIIGILSAVVLASLNSARAKGSDAAIRSNINNGRAQAELFYGDNGNNYNGGPGGDEVCTFAGATDKSAGVVALLTGADDAGSPDTNCDSEPNAYAMEAQLKSNDKFYCVDSTGFGGDKAVSKGTATACN